MENLKELSIEKIVREAKVKFLEFENRAEMLKRCPEKKEALMNAFVSQYVYENYCIDNKEVWERYLDYIID